MTAFVTVVTVSFLALTPVAAQTPAQVEAEPIVKLQLGDTIVPGQCLTEEELALNSSLLALTRPTVGNEGILGTDGGDDAQRFDPAYFLGTWNIEGVIPESALGESVDFTGTETVRHIEGCTYESTITGMMSGEAITITSLMVYDRQMRYLIRLEDDSRGYQFLKAGRVGGDPGGFFSHHWAAPAVTNQGTRVRLRGRTLITSPYVYRIQSRISEDAGPFINYGTTWWERPE